MSLSKETEEKKDDGDTEFWINGHDNQVTKYTAKIVAQKSKSLRTHLK